VHAAFTPEPVPDRAWPDIRRRVRQVARIEPADLGDLTVVGLGLAADDRRDEDRHIEEPDALTIMYSPISSPSFTSRFVSSLASRIAVSSMLSPGS
jgi:hypothetical protein